MKWSLPVLSTICALSALSLGGCNSFDIESKSVFGELKTYGAEHPERNIRIHTSLGDVEVLLFEDTPLHRANFQRLVAKGFYTDKAEFYRVKSNFMIQGGDPSRSEPSYLVPGELRPNHFHQRGALAMARRETNPAHASNPADFYIVQGETWTSEELISMGISSSDPRYPIYMQRGGTPHLDGKHTVFGIVTKGMEVVDKIARLQTYSERPLQPVHFSIGVAD